MKNNRLLIVLPFILTSLVGCNGNKDNKEAYNTDSPDYYANIEKRNAFDLENELNFNDEITNGLDDSVWNTLDGYWENGGTTPHNGVRRRNIFYTKDSTGNGYLALKARGLYNQEGPDNIGKPEGSCIETKNSLGPGRYEASMAAMPREGGVTAAWTYKCESSEDVSQNEIDIEIGGSGQFTNLWCTSWTRKTNKATHAPDVSNICYMNDGKIHKYTFDWYTDYHNSGEGRVDWFIDEQYVYSIQGGTVTDIDMPLWIGVWMPSWAGDAYWVEDYIIVDKVQYTAFDENQYYTSKRAYNTYSPKDPSQSGIQTKDFESITTGLNKLSNGDFETNTAYAENDYYGWNKLNPESFSGTCSFDNVNVKDGNYAFKLSEGSVETPEISNDVYYYQRISCSYEGFKYKFSVDAKLGDASSEAEIILWQRNKAGGGKVKQDKIDINGTNYATYEKEVTMLEGTSAIDVFLHLKSGTAYFDNAKLFKK